MIERLLSPHLVDALGWTLLHTLWQGALFAVLLGLVLIALRTYSAQARYLVAVGFLAAFFVTAGLTFAQLYTGAPPQTVQSRNGEGNPIHSTAAEAPAASVPSITNPADTARPAATGSLLTRARDYFDRHLPLLVTLWLLGVLVLQLRFLGQLVYVQRLKSYATEHFPPAWTAPLRELEAKLGLRRPVRYLTSHRVTGPFTAGWLRPVVLVPRRLLEELRESQLIAILAHELAHVKRYDFAVNVLQTLLGTFFFYHPGVWWMSARIHDEREHCCDDLAVAATGERIDYARTLVQLQEQALVTPKLAMAYGGGGFGHRVRRLLTNYLGTASFGEGVVTTLILGATLSLAMAAAGNDVHLAGGHAPASPPHPMHPLHPPTEVYDGVDGIDFKLDEDHHYNLNMSDVKQLVENESHDRQGVAFHLLMQAIYEGEIETVEYLLEQVKDLNQTDEHDFTPLMAAASEDELAIAQLLLDRGAEVNYLNRQGWTALTEAADEGSLSVARLLLEAGADVNLRGDKARDTPLSIAASEGHIEMIRLLVAKGADLRQRMDHPPLHQSRKRRGKSRSSGSCSTTASISISGTNGAVRRSCTPPRRTNPEWCACSWPRVPTGKRWTRKATRPCSTPPRRGPPPACRN